MNESSGWSSVGIEGVLETGSPHTQPVGSSPLNIPIFRARQEHVTIEDRLSRQFKAPSLRLKNNRALMLIRNRKMEKMDS